MILGTDTGLEVNEYDCRELAQEAIDDYRGYLGRKGFDIGDSMEIAMEDMLTKRCLAGLHAEAVVRTSNAELDRFVKRFLP